jgi:hypothetical protein
MLAEKLWICPGCQSQFVEAWRLARHLTLTHELSRTRAWEITDQSEYVLRVAKAIYVNPTEFAEAPAHTRGQRRASRPKRRKT